MLSACGSAHRSAGIPTALLSEARPIGTGARFQPPAAGPVLGPCRPVLGARAAAHVELFAQNRVVLIPAGIGTRAPRTSAGGRITRARCYGDLVTLAPTGVVLFAPGAPWTLADLFRSWGEPVSSTRLAGFAGRVRVYIDGRPRAGPPNRVSLTNHAEIVLEVGPYVLPHSSFAFPAATS